MTAATETAQCAHEDYDENDVCLDCGHDVQMYSDCQTCGWFGIPIIDSGAPDTCNICLANQIVKYSKAAAEAINEELQQADMLSCIDDASQDLQYFFDRQSVLDVSERRFNTGSSDKQEAQA